MGIPSEDVEIKIAGNHHTAKSFRQQAELPNTNNEDQFSALVSSRKSVLLQTADALISDTSEKKRQLIRVILDSASQKTYITKRFVKMLNLQPVGSKGDNGEKVW